jgi:dTDP-L-rhamnose 4-epimerase
MNKNILITGGAGFIGSNLTLKLIEKGHVVTILDNLSSQIHGDDPFVTSPLYRSVYDKVNFIIGTVTSADDLKKAILNQDVIVHLAAETGTGQSMYQIDHYTQVNIGGTALLLDILTNTKHKVTKVIIASSRSVYGEGKYYSEELGVVYPKHRSDNDMRKGDFEVKYPGCIKPLTVMATDEESKIHPSSVYGITKQNQEQLVMTVCPTINISPVAFRYQNVYGPGQSLTNPYTGILSIFSTIIRTGKEINVFEETANQIFNVGTGVPTSVNTVVRELINNFNAEVPVKITGNYRLGDIRNNYADINKVKSVLGFVPEVTFKQGIKRFVDWVNTQVIQPDRYQESIHEMKRKGLFK